MLTLTRIDQCASARSVQTLSLPIVQCPPIATHLGPLSRSKSSSPLGRPHIASSPSAPRTTDAPIIYAVDDMTDLIELYNTLLGTTGYHVRTFNDRKEALTTLKAEKTKPKLLITDYLGISMPVDQFLLRCLALHPTLRILMASGLSRTEMRFLEAKPDRFLEKPFTPEELRKEVRAALAS